MVTMKTSETTNLFALPKEIVVIAENLKRAEFEAYLIGGCVNQTFSENLL